MKISLKTAKILSQHGDVSATMALKDYLAFQPAEMNFVTNKISHQVSCVMANNPGTYQIIVPIH